MSFKKQLLFILLAGVIITAGALAIYSATPSGNLKIAGGYQQYGSGRPVAWWKMDEASWATTTDASPVKDSIGTNNGTPYNHASTTATAVFGRAGSFDGVDDYVGVATSTSLNITNAITISEWVKVGTGVSTWEPIFESVSGHATINRILLTNSGEYINKITIQFDIGGNNNNWYTNNTIARNTWVHIVYTFNGSLEKIYINGVLDRQYSKSGVIATGTEAMKIGWSETQNDYFNGLIDDVRIYNYALTADQVRQIYNETAKIKMVNQENTTTTSNNPVGWWKMDEGTGQYAYDVSGNGNTGTLGTSTNAEPADPTWTTGKLGKGLSFDGVNDYVSITNASNQVIPASNAAFSMSLWFNASAYPTVDYSAKCLIVNETYDVSGFRFGLYRNYGLSQISLYFWSGQSGGTVGLGSADGLVNLNTWYHITISYTGSSAKMYLNGIEVASDSSGVIVSNTNAIGIGAPYGGGGQYWNGLIDDVRIYNRALSAGEVGQMYNSTKDGYLGKIKVSTGLVGYWKLDDNNALTSVIDYSGKGNTGTAYSGTATSTSVLSTSTAMIGRAMSFDGGDDYVRAISTANLLGSGNDLTISMWVKPNNTQVAYNNLFDARINTGTSNYTIEASGTNITYGFNYLKGDGSGYAVFAGGTKYTTLTANIWQLFTVTKSGVNIDHYINGVKQGATGIVDNPIIAKIASQWTIGALSYGDIRYFNGLIDEVKIWNYARSAEDIKNDYAKGLAGLQ